MKQALIDAVIDQLVLDIKSGDYTVLNELLQDVEAMDLIQALPESERDKYTKNLL